MRGVVPSIAFFGDSILEGMAPHVAPLCYRALGGKLRVGVYARRGSSVKDWVENRWPEELSQRFRPNLVVIALGTNPQERDAYEYAGLMQRACSGAQVAGGVRCIVVGPFAEDPSGKRTDALLSSFPKGSALSGYQLAEGLPRAGENNVHFTPQGYQDLAERLVEHLVPAAVAVRRPGRALGFSASLAAAGGLVAATEGWSLPFGRL